MWSIAPLLITAAYLCYATRASGSAVFHDMPNLQMRNIIQANNIASSYDFVIVGGGVAGLVLANRLSEDTNTTVLVLEAGDTGASESSSINIPSNAYFSSLLGSSADWDYRTVSQPNAGGNAFTWPRGKVLGGSSAINGMYLVRPSQFEMDIWSSMISSQDNVSAAAWNWDNMFAAMKKTETFTPPSILIQTTGDIQYNTSSHGTNGPLHYSYPGYMLSTVGDWSPTLEVVGIPTNSDPSGGQTSGSFVATSSINPKNWTRSYARSAYLDPLPPRPNLAVLPLNTVTRIIFSGNSSEGNLIATQVEYASADGAPTHTVNVGKEVILTSGAIGSPQVLMLSGVGPDDVLEAADVNVNLILPGVGQHLQDHLASRIIYSATGDTDASIYSSKYGSQETPATPNAFLSFVNSATAYVNISTLLGADQASAFQSQIVNALSSSASSLVPSTDPTVIEGYKVIYNTTANQILTSNAGQVELLLGLTGTAQSGDESLVIQVALQHPYSQGQVYITSSDAFDPPAINPNYLSHFADLTMLREGLKLARQILQTAPLSNAVGNEILPGLKVDTDAEWDNYLTGAVSTEYHPTGTCAMLPRSQGGVVDANLLVYGLANVRVADASVYPIEFAAHLQAPTYALAEQAATIIRAQYNGISVPWAPPSTTSQPSSTTASSSQAQENGANKVRFPATGGLVIAFGTVFAIMGTSLLRMVY